MCCLSSCSQCANSLVANHIADRNKEGGCAIRFECRTCTYVHSVTSRIERLVPKLQKKEVDDVLGGDSFWEVADATEIPCPKCSHRKAFFHQMQTRSADEPMTTFYRCASCGHQWREN